MITLQDYSRENEEAQYWLTTSEGQGFAFSNFDDLTNDLEIYIFEGIETKHGFIKDLKDLYSLESWKIKGAEIRKS